MCSSSLCPILSTLTLLACSGGKGSRSDADVSLPGDSLAEQDSAESADSDSPSGESDSAADGDSATDSGAAGTWTAEAEPHRSCQEDSGIVLPTPEEHSRYLSEGFDRYARLETPSGGEILLFAQDQVSDEMLVRARSLLRFFLTDAPGTSWGDSKSDVAEAMASNGAVLAMINGADGEGREPRVQGQWLFEEETPVEGSVWYMSSDYRHRDAAFEGIFHLVHDAGVGA